MPLSQDELFARVAALHPAGTQRSYNVRGTVGDLYGAIAELAKYGYFVHVEDGAEALAETQEWPKMVYGEKGAAKVVGSQEELDGLEGQWGDSPSDEHGSAILEPSAPHLQGRMGGGVALQPGDRGVTEGMEAVAPPEPPIALIPGLAPRDAAPALTSDGDATHDEQGEGFRPGVDAPAPQSGEFHAEPAEPQSQGE